MPEMTIFAPIVHDCGGIVYYHPLALLVCLLLGAQIPNFVRLLSSINRLLRFWR